jgi:parvulin-like peptidyl-prolyl isomerase
MKRTAFFALLFACFGSLGFAQSDLQTVATINLIRSEAITVRQLRTQLETVFRQEAASVGQVPTPADITNAVNSLSVEQRRQALDAMINERLVIQAAERDRITITDNEVNQQIQQLRNGMAGSIGRQPTDAEFNLAIRNESGLELPAFRDQLRRQMIIHRYIETKQGTLLNSVTMPTEAEILQQFNLHRAQFVRPETVRFSMIQVPYGPDAASRTRARDLANSLSREIGSNPSKFDEVFIRGQAPNAGFQAGDGGFLPRSPDAQALVGAVFMNTAFTLRQGEVSTLIEGVPGFQIIKVTESYAMRALELNDILQPGSQITVRNYIGQVLLQNKQQEVAIQAQQEVIAELRSSRTFQVFEQHLNWR